MKAKERRGERRGGCRGGEDEGMREEEEKEKNGESDNSHKQVTSSLNLSFVQVSKQARSRQAWVGCIFIFFRVEGGG